MIELLFSDSAAGTLMCAKSLGNGTIIGGVSAKITMDSDGNQTCERFEPEPYTGPTVEGDPSDVAGIWLNADIGDISNLSDWSSRIKLMRDISDGYDFEDDEWVEKEAKRASELISRLLDAANSGEHIRVWWSDAPGEACGYYWAMDILQNAVGLITAVKIPAIYPTEDGYLTFSGTGELSPEQFPLMLRFEREVEQAERKAVATEWRKLVNENSPLRAVINGHISSVPADFYDYVLRKVIPDTECRVAQVIGIALAEGPGGISDWWYSGRLRLMIESGEVEIIKENKTFYGSAMIRRNNVTSK